MEKEINNFITDNCALYNGDCLEVMDMLIEKGIKVDAIITDPPYGVLNKNNKNAQWDSVIPYEALWKRLDKLMKDNTPVILFSQGMFTAKLMLSNESIWRYNLIWKKGERTSGFLNARRMPLRNHEDICIFYKKLPTYNPQMTKGKINHSKGNLNCKNNVYGDFTPSESLFNGEKFPKSILNFEKDHPSSFHPTQKPVSLMEYLIKTYTNEGELVLDFTMGSGTTCVAARNTNRKSIGIELEKKYFDIAVSRYKGEEIVKESKKEETKEKGLKLASWKKK